MNEAIPLTVPWVLSRAARPAVNAAIARVLDSERLILGAEVEAFEREFGAFLGLAGGVGVGSGTDALTLALMAGGIGPGDEVLVPAFAPGATITGVLAAGATPVLADVGWDFGLDLERLPARLSARTRALVAVHLYGRVDAMTALGAFAKEHGLWLVEDCAQAHGAGYFCEATQSWGVAGSFGDVAAFSFYPTKNLGCAGDGGFCSSRSANVLERLRELRQYGWRVRDDSERAGRNSRLDELQAAILREGLRVLGERNACRRSMARRYVEELSAGAVIKRGLPGVDEPHRQSVFHLFVLRESRREQMRERLGALQIETGVHYPRALSQQRAYARYGAGARFPVAEHLAATVVSLPFYPELEWEKALRVFSAVNQHWEQV